MDGARADSTVHAGAVHLHLGEQYLVRTSTSPRVALVRPFNGDYYTQAKRLSSIASWRERTVRDAEGMPRLPRRHRDARAGGRLPA